MQNLGELLRDEREKKGLSLKEIENAISIRTLYISAIEEGNYNIIPGEVYLKGFIRNYANYLGLNGQEMVDLYRRSQNPVAENLPVASDSVENPAIHAKQITNNNSAKWLIISMLSVCVVGLAWWLLASPKSATEPQVNTQAQTSPVTPIEPLPPKATQTTTPAAQTKPVVITATYTEQCWTSVTADGNFIYEGTPPVGDKITWEAQKNIVITTGNAGGVDIIANGQAIGKLGTKGEVVVKTFVAKQ